MLDIVGGAVLIAIGLVRGHSVFRGEFTVLTILFDALGVFFIIRGIIRINRAKQAAVEPPPAPPPPPR